MGCIADWIAKTSYVGDWQVFRNTYDSLIKEGFWYAGKSPHSVKKRSVLVCLKTSLKINISNICVFIEFRYKSRFAGRWGTGRETSNPRDKIMLIAFRKIVIVQHERGEGNNHDDRHQSKFWSTGSSACSSHYQARPTRDPSPTATNPMVKLAPKLNIAMSRESV